MFSEKCTKLWLMVHDTYMMSKQYSVPDKTYWTTVHCMRNKNLPSFLDTFNEKSPPEPACRHKLRSGLWFMLFIASLVQLTRTQKHATKHKIKTTVHDLYKHLQSIPNHSIKKARSYWVFQYESPAVLCNLTLSSSHRLNMCFLE